VIACPLPEAPLGLPEIRKKAMAQETGDKPEPQAAALSERIKEYCQELQSLIAQGIEHPRFEFKRSSSISRDNLDDRLDFIKLLQGVANAEIAGERCIIIGGDPKEKKFYPVSNTAEFDPATVSTVVDKYLDPPPRFELFNNLQTEDGQPFVLFVLDANQPRPIVVKTEGKRTDGKTRLQMGDIWIKKGTSLQPATRADLDLMYRLRMEAEAEDRARKRFSHFSELSGAPPSAIPSPLRLPVRELLVGPAQELRRFGEELIVSSDYSRFRMFLELARESLVEGWDNLNAGRPGFPSNVPEHVSAVNDFFRDEFLPSLQSVVSLALLVIKYDFQPDWLQAVFEILLEAFDASRDVQLLKSGYVIQEPNSLRWWRPAFEIYVASRCLATYALSRNRPRFLGVVLPRFIARITVDNQRSLKTPVLFWPLPPDPFPGGELNEGRNAFYWKERISGSWVKYFGTYEKFLGPACELEFLIEFNSYLGTNSINDAGIQRWLEANSGDLSFIYNPDLFSYDLHWTVPMAERCYDLIAADKPFPAYLAVEPALFELAFKDKNRDQRLSIYGGFLHHLKSWQATVMMQGFRRFPFMYNWEGRLLEIVQKYKAQLPKKA
jgi:hypothetical protein